MYIVPSSLRAYVCALCPATCIPTYVHCAQRPAYLRMCIVPNSLRTYVCALCPATCIPTYVHCAQRPAYLRMCIVPNSLRTYVCALHPATCIPTYVHCAQQLACLRMYIVPSDYILTRYITTHSWMTCTHYYTVRNMERLLCLPLSPVCLQIVEAGDSLGISPDAVTGLYKSMYDCISMSIAMVMCHIPTQVLPG